jgi:hypothetical protein
MAADRTTRKALRSVCGTGVSKGSRFSDRIGVQNSRSNLLKMSCIKTFPLIQILQLIHIAAR